MSGMKQVLFKLNEEEYGINIMDVVSIERGASMIRVPGAPKHILGLIKLRGEMVPVYSLRTRFGMPQKDPTILIITRCQGIKLALAVDEVSEILEVEDQDLLKAPEIVQTETTAFVRQVTNVKGHVFLLLSVDGILLENEKEAIESMLRKQMEAVEKE